MKNLGTVTTKVELKVWLTIPGMAPISFLNLGGDGSLTIPTGANQNLGPLTLFNVTSSFPRGDYQFNSRTVDPATGAQISEDLNTFLIQ